MKSGIYASIVALSISLGIVEVSLAGRDIPDDHLSLPVLVTLDSGGEASGSYLQDTNYFYFATAYHVLFDPATTNLRSKAVTLLSYTADPTNATPIKIKLDLMQLMTNMCIRSSPGTDATVLRIGKTQTGADGRLQIVTEGKYVQWIEGLGKGDIMGFPVSGLRKFEETLVGNTVYLFGYPISLGIKEMPQLEHDRPLLRKGIVAGKNHVQCTVIIDCPTYYGNSGGPVVQTELTSVGNTSFRIIGIVSQFIPFQETWVNTTHKISHWEISNSGYSVVIPSDRILELIDQLSRNTK